MLLKELFKHFKDKSITVDLCTALWRKFDTIENFENNLSEDILNIKVYDWKYSNSILEIDM